MDDLLPLRLGPVTVDLVTSEQSFDLLILWGGLSRFLSLYYGARVLGVDSHMGGASYSFYTRTWGRWGSYNEPATPLEIEQ